MSDSPKLFWISGPPASGKTTLCKALLATFERAIHIPVDDVRNWVCSGMADSVPWTDETERQFQIAESAVSDIAKRYLDAGFTVAMDHCRNPQRLEKLIVEHLTGYQVVKVCLMPDFETNLDRSHSRTNKTFDPHLLDDTIRFTNEHYRLNTPPGWLMLDNTHLSVAETVARIQEGSC